MTRRIYPPRIVITIVKAIIRVFTKTKRSASDEVPGGEKKEKMKKTRTLSVFPRSRKKRHTRGNVCSCLVSMPKFKLYVNQPRTTGLPKSRRSPTSYSSKYSIAIDWPLWTTHRGPGNGTDSRTFATGGDISYSHRLVGWIYNSFTHTKIPSGRL